VIITKSDPFSKEEILQVSQQKVIIESLAMDLKRIALGLHRGSFTVADRFKIEAIKRISELEKQSTSLYLNKLLKKNIISFQKDNQTISEDALMFSTLFQNYSRIM
jgi:hypothetical protein